MTVEIVTLNSVGSKTGNHAHIVTRMLFVGPYLIILILIWNR